MLPDKVGTIEYKVPTCVRRIMVPYGHFDPYKGLYSLDTFCDVIIVRHLGFSSRCAQKKSINIELRFLHSHWLELHSVKHVKIEINSKDPIVQE